jgi:hypothetical protein
MLLGISPVRCVAMAGPPTERFGRLAFTCLIDPFRTFFNAYRICDYSYPGKSLEDVIWVTEYLP